MPTEGFSVRCAAPASMFAYPIPDEKKEGDSNVVTVTAVLSTTARTKQREAKALAKKQNSATGSTSLSRQPSLEKVLSGLAPPPASDGPSLQHVTSHLSTTSYLSVSQNPGGINSSENTKKVAPKEPSSFMLANPCRLTFPQRRYVNLVEDNSRYVPVFT